jgi:hypothetical protein
MNAIFRDFAKQNHEKWHSFIILFRRRRRRMSFETASAFFGAPKRAEECPFPEGRRRRPAVRPSKDRAESAEWIAKSFEAASMFLIDLLRWVSEVGKKSYFLST